MFIKGSNNGSVVIIRALRIYHALEVKRCDLSLRGRKDDLLSLLSKPLPFYKRSEVRQLRSYLDSLPGETVEVSAKDYRLIDTRHLIACRLTGKQYSRPREILFREWQAAMLQAGRNKK